MNGQFTRTRAGQSAIEYLTTYGWALLAIIIVGAVLVQMGVFNQCQQTTPRFSGQAVAIESWGFQSNTQLSMSLQSINQDVNVTSVAIDFGDDGTDDVSSISGTNWNNGVQLDAGTSDTIDITLTGAEAPSSGSCARTTVSFTYNVVGGPSNLQATGSGNLGGPVP